jgi:hypothetical protein
MKVAAKQSVKLNKTLKNAAKSCPFWANCNVSFEKVEKVEKPPQKPVANSKRWASVKLPLVAEAVNAPIMKHAKTLDSKVANGKSISKRLIVNEIP